MIDIVLPLVIITILIVLNGLFVAAEFAIIGVRPTRVAQLAEQGSSIAAGIKAILDDPRRQDRYIATAQLGITIASLGLGMYGEHVIAEWLLGPLEHWIHLSEGAAHTIAAVLSLALLTFAHVVVGEMVPKSLALQYAERTVLGIAGFMHVITIIFYPAVLALNALGNAMLRLIGITPAATSSRLYSPEELELIVTESHAGGLVSDSEQRLIKNIFDFSERHVGQVMTPRPRIVAIPLDSSTDDLQRLMATSPYSRFPVYDGTIDQIVGQLLMKDVVRQQLHQPGPIELQRLLRHLPVVPETMPVQQLFASLKHAHIHIALVVDEYGGTAGLVTLEDLVEEVVGEVYDEFDADEPPPIREVAPGVLMVRGSMLIDDLAEVVPALGAELDKHLGIETVGGLIGSLLGRPPRPGDQAKLQGVAFTVEQVRGFAVETARVVVDRSSQEVTDSTRTQTPLHP